MSLEEEVAELFCDAQAPLADKIRAYKRPWFSSLRVFVKREVEQYNRRVRFAAEELERRRKRSEPSPPKLQAEPEIQGRPACPRWTYTVQRVNTRGRCWHCKKRVAREVLGQRLCEQHAEIRELTTRRMQQAAERRRSAAA